MMKIQVLGRIVSYLVISIFTLQAQGQIRLPGYKASEINQELYTKGWDARWISSSGQDAKYSVIHFRKLFHLESVPEKFIIHVSADNRYKLYLNGMQISMGPAGGDIMNWNFETVDLTPYLKEGNNILAAVVWNFGDDRPVAQMSVGKTELIVQGNTATEAVVNTNASWKCMISKAYSPIEASVLGYFVVGSGEKFASERYLWGWDGVDFDDRDWQKAKEGMSGAIKGAVDYPGRQLVPSPIPEMTLMPIRFNSIRKITGIEHKQNDIARQPFKMMIPAHSKVEIVLDQAELTTGYPVLTFSSGKDANIKIGYAESFYEDTKAGLKGNRKEIEGKTFIGYQDQIIADGGMQRVYSPLWWRTWRYIELKIETGEQELVLEDIAAFYSTYPFKKTANFSAPGRPDLERMLDIGWRTARLCAHDTYMDCPYYEQLQYFGDTRIQTMVTMYNTRDDAMVKNALEQGRRSLVPDGITQSRYPSNIHQFIPSFSLWWIGMGHDYWQYRGDEVYLKTLLPAYRFVLSWFEEYLDEEGSLGKLPYWFFGDWSKEFGRGIPPTESDGGSAFQDLVYLLALDAAADMEECFGQKSWALHYRQLAKRIRTHVQKAYWNEKRKLYADTYTHKSYSQHVNSMAILAGIVTGDKSKVVMHNLLSDTTIAQSTIYFRYYVQRAMQKSGLGDELLKNLDIWQEQMALGLTTWAEEPEPSRSDCHAWGASPNIEFYRIVLGIDAAAPGFRKVRIEPHLASLKRASGQIPHPNGIISVQYEVNGSGQLIAQITLPDNVRGIFVWKGKSYPLKGGRKEFKL